MPACAKTCPPGAIRFGDREEMVALGQKRVAALQGAGLANANLYGADLLGGLGRMFVLGTSPANVNLPERPTYPILVRLWQQVFQPLGQLGVIATVVGVAAHWLATRRLREKKQEEV
jgi:hypothetical protein